MANALDRIIEYKKDEVSALKQHRTVSSFEALISGLEPVRGFSNALTATALSGENGLICELKRKSPSAGEILPGADPCDIAREYEDGGASCLSVLTDGPSFGGSLADFEKIRAAVRLPMLRKDFMIDPIQVAESRAHGADCVLVIMACLSDEQAKELHDYAISLGMDVLVETHNEAELTRALNLSSPLLGINNRDLTKMVTDLATTEELAHMVPENKFLVSESGIAETDHILRLRKTGARRFLIGESLMKRITDRSAHVRALRSAGT